MTCEEFEQILFNSRQLVSGADCAMRTSRSARIQEHVDNCPVCAKRLAEIVRLEGALDQFRLSTMHLEAPASVERNLLSAFRDNAAQARSVSRRATGWRLAWLGAAIVMLVVIGVGVYSTLQTRSVVKMDAKSNGRELIQIPSGGAASKSGTQAFQEFKDNHRTGRIVGVKSGIQLGKGSKTALHSGGRRVPTAADEFSLNGGGSVVRVTLPFSSLVAMGIPVRPDISDSQVTADVWVDPFGGVVGVRLVPANTSAD